MKPMLAKDCNDLSTISYPVYAQLKLDGIRASVVDGQLVSRSLKPIQNREIQAALGRPEFEGLDGELIVGFPEEPGCMQATSSFVMSADKTGGAWTYFVFDKWNEPGNYAERWEAAWRVYSEHSGSGLTMVNFTACSAESELAEFEGHAVAAGHEGIIVRSIEGDYKFGRSGKAGPLLKVKRFIDFEASVVGTFEKMHNGNEATRNALGRTERSSAKAGKSGLGTLGGFELVAVNGPHAGGNFRCGTGFNDEMRALIWNDRENVVGRMVKIKSFPVGTKDAPRFPVFLGFRHADDL